MKFKTPRIKQEFDDLKKHNPNLLLVLDLLDKFCDDSGLEEPIITCLLRTKEENAKANGIANSPHLTYEGADLRSFIYKPDEIKDMLDFLNSLGYTWGNGKKTAIYHAVPGGVSHFHIQVRRPK